MSTQPQQHTGRIESSGSSPSVSTSHHDNMIIRSNMPFNESIINSSDDEMSGKLQPTTTTGVVDAPSIAAEGKRSGIATSKKVQSTKFKKNPRAPKRFKSAFIIFSAEKHKEIRAAAVAKDPTAQKTNVAKLVSEAWKKLPTEEKAHWEERARKDKVRYEIEKSMYSGPWKVPAGRGRTPKDPDAPKRPMSAFLAFSNKRRASVKASNPDASNAELSKILSKMWKEAPEGVRKTYVDEEAGLRQQYHASMSEWRKKEKELKDIRDKQREDIAFEILEAQQQRQNRGDQQQEHDQRQSTRVAAVAAAAAAARHPFDSLEGYEGDYISSIARHGEVSSIRNVQPRTIDLLRMQSRHTTIEDLIPSSFGLTNATPRRGVLEEARLSESALQSAALVRASASLGARLPAPFLNLPYQELERARLLRNAQFGINPAGGPFPSSVDVESAMASDAVSNLARRLLEGSNTPYYQGSHPTGSTSLYSSLGQLTQSGSLRGPSLDLLNDNSASSSVLPRELHHYQQHNINPYDQLLGSDRRGPPLQPPRRGFDNP